MIKMSQNVSINEIRVNKQIYIYTRKATQLYMK